MLIPQGRHSIRLKDYDYSQSGLYDITICTFHRYCLFGEVERMQMKLNNLGLLVRENWRDINQHWPFVDLLEYQVMPNHVHGLILIKDRGKDDLCSESVNASERELGTEGKSLMGTINCAPTLEEKREVFGKSTKGSIPTIIKMFKAGVTRRKGITPILRENYGQLWQRGYYEHIIHSEAELGIRINYIRNNPQNWDRDIYYKSGD
jgi:putative transposase